MLDPVVLMSTLGACVLAAPVAFLTYLALSSLIERPVGERSISAMLTLCMVMGFAAAVALLVFMLAHGTLHFTLELDQSIAIADFHFSLKFVFDMLSVPFVILCYVLCGTVGAFADGYMHREPGFNRFFVLYALFVLGMTVTALAGTIETLFTGWELVGLSSALVVAFFHERPMPVRNGLRVWSVYRISDAALLIAAVVLHHLTGHGDFDAVFGTESWPGGQSAITPEQALIVGTLLFIAAMGKSALVPFSGWLPRAMEGPTPSSAVFYGALSVHLGAFLLLRISPILEQSALLCGIIIAVGLMTAVFATLAGRVQTDIKSALAFASLTQVGIIVVEIGLGLRWIALAHLLGHACLRTLQFLRAPTLLHDYHMLENALGTRLQQRPGWWQRLVPERAAGWFYRFALERGYLDALLNDYVARPLLRLFRWCDKFERRWTDFLAGRRAPKSLDVRPTPGPFDETI